MVECWLCEGGGAAGYLLACAEAAVRRETISMRIRSEGAIAVDNILVQAQMERWNQSHDWSDAKLATMFVMSLAAPKERMLEVSKTIARRGRMGTTVMRCKPSASLRRAFERAKKAAMEKEECTIIGVNLCDVTFSEMSEEDFGVHDSNITFAHWFVLGICPGRMRVWQAGGQEGEYTLQEHLLRNGDTVMKWEEAGKLIDNFEIFALPRGCWNKARLKAYERVTGIDLRQARDRGVRDLLVEYKTWVELIILENVRREDLAKFVWM
ncbi:MAG: hypothetical protein Q9164_007248 [Protoblastenia rupestris]